MLDRATPPPYVKSSSLVLPEPEVLSLNNGIDLILINQVGQEVMKIEGIAEAGKWFEDMPGQAHLAAHMLEKGTQTRSASELADFFERHGASIEINSGMDHLSVSLYALTHQADKVLPVFIEMLTRPGFDRKELELLKSIFIQTLKVNNEKTSHVASKLLRQSVFGSTHPYGLPVEEDDVQRLDQGHLSDFFFRHMKFRKFFVAGKIQMKDLAPLLGSLSTNGSDATPGAGDFVVPAVQSQKVEKSAAVQSSIRLGRRIVGRLHADYFPLLLLNHYLGGFFGSQLMQNLREDKGLTYGISSAIRSFKNDGLLVIGTDVNKSNADFAVDQIREELKKVKEGRINPKDLELARRHFIGSVQAEVANPFSILGKIKNRLLHGLPGDYYQAMLSSIDSVSMGRLAEVGEKYFDEIAFHRVIVG